MSSLDGLTTASQLKRQNKIYFRSPARARSDLCRDGLFLPRESTDLSYYRDRRLAHAGVTPGNASCRGGAKDDPSRGRQMPRIGASPS